MIYAPSLACANQLNLESDLRELLDLGLNCIHFDIMDGHYVPNICLSMDTGTRLKQVFPQVDLDVHVMVSDPEAYVDRVAAMGARYMTFHLGAAKFPLRLIDRIKAAGMQAGVAINPSEPISLLEPLLNRADLILLMSIEPGFAGVAFIDETYTRLAELARIRTEGKLPFDISLDGGISTPIAKKLIGLGADILVLGYPNLFNQPEGITAAWNRAKTALESDRILGLE